MPRRSLAQPAGRRHDRPAAEPECVTCHTALVGDFCHACGEKRRSVQDLTLRAFAYYAFEAMTNADARLYATLRALFLRPGLLTREFMAGRRRPYLGPLQLFLLANFSFFVALQAGWGSNAFTTDLVYHQTQPLYGAVAGMKIEERFGPLPERRADESRLRWVASWNNEQRDYRERFNSASPRYANSLIVLMVPLFALVLRLMRFRTLFVRELVLSFHFYSFLLLGLILVPAILFLAVYVPLLLAAPHLLASLQSDAVYSILLSLVVFTYLALAFRTAHRDSWPAALLRAGVAPVLLLFVITFYRMILFFVVFAAV
jgi:hypothetical protein